MALTDQINDGIKNAMRAKDKPRLEALRAVKAALLLELTKGGDAEIDEKTEMQILMKMHKQRRDSAAIFREQNRPDLAEDEEFQAGVLEDFLPEQMSEADIEKEVAEIISSVGAEDKTTLYDFRYWTAPDHTRIVIDTEKDTLFSISEDNNYIILSKGVRK